MTTRCKPNHKWEKKFYFIDRQIFKLLTNSALKNLKHITLQLTAKKANGRNSLQLFLNTFV